MNFFVFFFYHTNLNFLCRVRKNGRVAKFSFTAIKTRKILVEVKQSIIDVYWCSIFTQNCSYKHSELSTPFV